jgi:hypothetical protein
LVVFALVIATSPFTLVGMAFWAADGPWEFMGGGLRHWIFIKGSTVDRLSFVASTGRSPRYVVRLGEGTDPGETSVNYDSHALPDGIVAAYADRCRAIGFAVKKRIVMADATEARLVCEGDRAAAWSDDVFVIAKHLAEGTTTATTQVRIFAGPGLTATYDF